MVIINEVDFKVPKAKKLMDLKYIKMESNKLH